MASPLLYLGASSALDIAAFFIRRGVSPLKVQKLLYYTQVWHFVRYERYAFYENLRAWIYGPVVHEVWSELKFMRRNETIPVSAANRISNLSDTSFNYALIQTLDGVWSAYGHLTGSQLVDLTHKEKPWILARKGLCDLDRSSALVQINKETTSEFRLDVTGGIPVIAGDRDAIGLFSNY